MIERRIGHKGIGFGAAIAGQGRPRHRRDLRAVLPEDLLQYGLIPEFIGRLPVMSAVHQLTRDDLVSILTEPRNALVKQFQRFFSFDDIELVFADDALHAIAEKGLERDTGARGLRSIIEESCSRCSSSCPRAATCRSASSPRRRSRRALTPTLVTEPRPTSRGEAARCARSRPSSG